MMDRRSFLKSTLAASGGLGLSVSFAPLSQAEDLAGQSTNKVSGDSFNPYLEISPDNQIIFTLARTEMGQNISTGLVTALAEELEINPQVVVIKNAPVNKAYYNTVFPMQMTGGSTSIRSDWKLAAEAGATAREMLKLAAAEVWNIPVEQCQAENGMIINNNDQSSLNYGQLAKAAALSPTPLVTLKKPADYKLIGKYSQKVNQLSKVNGTAVYGIDIVVPDMRYAEVIHSPTIHGKLISFDDSAAKKIKGIEAIFAIEAGIAVVGSSLWSCKKASKLVEAKWQTRNNPVTSSEQLFSALKAAAKQKGATVRKEGDAKLAFETSDKHINTEYTAPYLAHACMEPMCCTARIQNGKAEIWAPNQGPDIAREAVHQVTKIPHADIEIHTTLMGGGFGRKLMPDVTAEAAQISQHIQQPVKVIWSRETDTQNDYYRPASYNEIKLGIKDNQLDNLQAKLVAPAPGVSVMPHVISTLSPKWLPVLIKNGAGTLTSKLLAKFSQDETGSEGIADTVYKIPNLKVSYVYTDPLDLPVGYWRSVGHSHNAFIIESAIDEAAHLLMQDPYLLRQQLLPNNSRELKVLNAVADKAKWQQGLASNRFQGIAVHQSFGTYVAQIVEVSVEESTINVHKVTCAIDCGMVVNPIIVKQQMESGIIFGLTAALKGKITIEDDKIQQSNFHDYQMLRINETPDIDVVIVESGEEASGVGEPGTPPVAPALANAVFAATGQRLRDLPLKLS